MSEGNGRSVLLTFTEPPRRVVSLVPSMTGSMLDLQLGEHLVGVTDYCLPQETGFERLARVGGTRSPDTAKILALKPDLVLANQEENTRQTVEELEAHGIRVWVTFPRTVEQAIDILWAITSVFRRPTAHPMIRALEVTLGWTERAAQEVPRQRVFCPIWQDVHEDFGVWWMTFNQQTYAHDLLARLGADNIFAGRQRRYPLAADLGDAKEESVAARDIRYPRVHPAEIAQAAPEIILLPNDPFALREGGVERIKASLESTPAVLNDRVHIVDGRLITWHGTRLGMALRDLPAILSPRSGT